MDRSLVLTLIDLFERSSLGELEFEAGGTRIRLMRGEPLDTRVRSNLATPLERTSPTQRNAEPIVGIHVIVAPCIGVFYRQANPNEPPLISLGDIVSEGQTIGIVEAMKVFNSIEADRDGRIIEIKQQDGASVEVGTPLFVVELLDGSSV